VRALRNATVVLLAIGLALLGLRPAAAEPSGGQFLAVSDLHFDAMADPILVDRLAAAQPADWPALLAKSKTSGTSNFGQDTNWPLLHSALERMRTILPKPAFLLVPGDFLAHSYQKRFGAVASDHSDAAYRAFVVKTIQFLAGQLQAEFPDTPILPVLGNNDSECGNYRLQPDGPFLHDTLPVVRGLLRSGLGAEFDGDWTAAGNYNLTHPTLHGVRVMFANTVFFSRNYRNACGGGEPGKQTLDWLRAQLDRARQNGEKAWLLYHIPPGIDAYATLHGSGCPEGIVPMWDASYVAQFAELQHEFADTIEATFAGHTHRDEFRLAGAPGERDGFVLVVPALSPVYDQNPAFQVFAYDASGGILDSATHYVANLTAAASGAAAPEWQTEPSFTEAWQLPRINLGTLETLYERIGADRDAGTRWLLRYAVSRAEFWPMPVDQGLVPDKVFSAYRCTIGNMSAAEFRACYCGAP
jgi:hypothetical protein